MPMNKSILLPPPDFFFPKFGRWLMSAFLRASTVSMANQEAYNQGSNKQWVVADHCDYFCGAWTF